MPFTSTRPKLNLTQEQILYLQDIVINSKNFRMAKRAKVLLLFNDNLSIGKIANQSNVSTRLVIRIIDRVHKYGIEAAISELPRSGRPKKLNP